MKRRELIKTITADGAVFLRHGGKHDWYVNHATGAAQPVPRHTEISEPLAKHIIKMLRRP